LCGSSRVDLVDDDDISLPEIGLAGIVREFIAGTQRIGNGDLEVWNVEREVVVAAVPDDDVRFLFCLDRKSVV